MGSSFVFDRCGHVLSLLLLLFLVPIVCACFDGPPSPFSYTCAQQRDWGKCNDSWMLGYCEVTCGKCTPTTKSTCNEQAPSSAYTCTQQRDWGKCGESWMAGYCEQTCGVCSGSSGSGAGGGGGGGSSTPTSDSSCSDVQIPGDSYGCAQQAAWGKCGESWTAGYCASSCNRCSLTPTSQPVSLPTTIIKLPAFTASTRLMVSNQQLLLYPSSTRVFLSGGNMAWQSYGADFGSGVSSALLNAISAVRNAGGNSIRIWLHCSGTNNPKWGSNGHVTGLPTNFISDLKSYLLYARQHSVLINLVLWNFMITDSHAALYTDTAVLQSYIDNALIPLVTALKNEPALGMWEISNEPEGASIPFGWQSNKVSMAQIQRAINWQADAIHATAPNALVTVGSWSFKALTDLYGFTNYYTNARLIAAGGRNKGYLDVYQVHYYSWMGRNTFLSALDHNRDDYGLDKPLIVGEFSSSGSQGVPITTLYNTIFNRGYDGAWAWQLNGGGQDADSETVILQGVASLSSRATGNTPQADNVTLPTIQPINETNITPSDNMPSNDTTIAYDLVLNMTLSLDFSTVQPSSVDFIQRLTQDIASSISGLDASRIVVLSLHAGSTVVTFGVLPSRYPDAVTLSSVSIQLRSQSLDRSSPLYAGTILQHIETLTFVKDTLYNAANTVQCTYAFIATLACIVAIMLFQ